MTEEITIDEGIPIPPKSGRGHTRWYEIAEKMTNGDSVQVETLSEAKALAYVIRYYGFRAVQRKMDDHYRVWKIHKEVNSNVG